MVPATPEPPFEVCDAARAGERCLRSLAAFAEGDAITRFRAAIVRSAPSRATLQVSETEHVELSPAALLFVNHSCAPNVGFDVERWTLAALRPIAPGDELTFFYPATEWAMDEPFACACRSPACLRRVAGASQMSANELEGHRLAPHIVRLIDRDRRRRAAQEGPPAGSPRERPCPPSSARS